MGVVRGAEGLSAEGCADSEQSLAEPSVLLEEGREQMPQESGETKRNIA